MSAFEDIEAIGPLRVWNDVVAREVHGEQSTLAVVELVVGLELEDEPLVDVAQVVLRRDVPVGVGEEVVRELRVLLVVREVVRHRWRCSMR